MNEGNKVLSYANRLEDLLRNYLNCHYTEFGVKANNNLTDRDWKSPINFALGYCYASSNDNPEVKKEIEYFLGNELQGKSIGDVVNNYEHYGFTTQEEAYEYIHETLEALRGILSKAN